MEKSRDSFTGRLGFVLAAAGSAVGLGNLWRFPYLAAKDGGGVFLLCYLILALTFGFTLLTTELAIGRKTGESALGAFKKLHPKAGWIGVIATLIPALILPYYCVIGGWVSKFTALFISGDGVSATAEGFFDSFITHPFEPLIWLMIFVILTTLIVYLGVGKGIEKMSKILMPILLVLIVGIALFSLTLSYTNDAGITRTGLEGFMIYVIPNFEGMTISQFMQILMDAAGQLFYSISVAMGIMITYGSYVKKDVNLGDSVNQIEFFDTFVAFLAGLMIVPAVYTFMGLEGMKSGPTLMFVSLPKVFEAMGVIGPIIGTVFFVTVLFAALTSSVSVMEAVVSGVMDRFHMERKKATILICGITTIIGIIVCLGYNVLFFKYTLPNGTIGQILDILDYISNYVLMPVVSIATCILIGWILKPEIIYDEVEQGKFKFGRKKLYTIMLKYIVPVLLVILLLQALGLRLF